mgnify:CR=1 FL=1
MSPEQMSLIPAVSSYSEKTEAQTQAILVTLLQARGKKNLES